MFVKRKSVLISKEIKLKKLFVSFILLLSILVFGGCPPGPEPPVDPEVTDADKVALDAEALAVIFGGSDSESSVTGDLTLPVAGENGSVITWSSSNTGVIASNGTVTRPAYGSGNAVVTLTATISIDAETQTKTFTLTVLEALRLASDKVSIDYGEGGTFAIIYVPGKTFYTDNTATGPEATVTNGYEIGETEVTYNLWAEVYAWATNGAFDHDGDGATGDDIYDFHNGGTMGDNSGDETGEHPVTFINWRDAIVWTNALTEYCNSVHGTAYAPVYTVDDAYTIPIRDSVDGAYSVSFNLTPGGFDNPYVNPDAKGFRLPTKNEWDLAARYINDLNGDGDILDAGEYYPGDYASGASISVDADTDDAATALVCWYSFNASGTNSVATKEANALGLYDMSGNVLELNFDWDSDQYPVPVLESDSGWRERSGGAFSLSRTSMKVGNSYGQESYKEYIVTGFRIARTP